MGDALDDIRQATRVRLWELEPSRFDRHDDAWVMQQLAAAMRRRGEARSRQRPATAADLRALGGRAVRGSWA